MVLDFFPFPFNTTACAWSSKTTGLTTESRNPENVQRKEGKCWQDVMTGAFMSPGAAERPCLMNTLMLTDRCVVGVSEADD